MNEQRKIAEDNLKLAHHIQTAAPFIKADQQLASFEKQRYYSKFSQKFTTRQVELDKSDDLIAATARVISPPNGHQRKRTS